MKSILPLSQRFSNTFLIMGMIMIMLLGVRCTSGKKRMEKGDYDTAVLQAVKRLRSNPDHKKASNILPMAYEYATLYHLDEITRLKSSTAQFKYDGVVRHYEQMNKLYRAIDRCPACKDLVYNPKYYQQELDESRLAASKAHFDQGVKDLEKRTMNMAREAYKHFQRAHEYTPEYDGIDQYLAESLEAATLHVMIDDIPIHSRSLNLTNEFFQNQIIEEVKRFNYAFVQFHTVSEVDQFNIEPDEIVLIKFDDFVVGQTYVKETQIQRSRDSVEMGHVETEGGKMPVYGTAKATVTHIFKSVTSTGLMDFQVVNANSGQTLKQSKLPGTYIWEWDWGFYNGQEEALEEEDLEIVRRKEAYPPPPQELFIAFTQPIYNQIINQMKRYYQVHN